MFQIQSALVSSEVIHEMFVCDLKLCKGQCCVGGDAGAPLDADELPVLEAIYPDVEPYLTHKGRLAIESHHMYIKGTDGDWETPLVDGNECAYAVFDSGGVASCAIEKAYEDGAVSWRKPISCHLYPIRLTNYPSYIAVNYNRWHLCSSACVLGQTLDVPVYKFLKGALIRKFGKTWYQELELTAKTYISKK